MVPPTQPRQSIGDYFSRTDCSAAPVDTPSQSATSSMSGSSQAATSADTLRSDSHERPQKKIRITAENGRDIALRGSQEKKAERISKAKRTTVPVRQAGRRAKLGLLPSVPLDVLLEIFSHLAPLDILRLSRTTKELRRLLLHRSSTCVWKAALDSIEGLPPCPKDLSLPAWTNLVFDHHCQNCLTTNVKKCDFNLRVRYCNKCANLYIFQISDFNQDNLLHQVILQCIHFTTWNNRTELSYHVADKLKFLEELRALVDKDDDAIQNFVTQKEAEVEERMEHAEACQAWMETVNNRREQELNNSRKARADAIRAKLMELGYQAEFEFLDNFNAGVWAIWDRWPSITKFDNHQLVRLPKPLTERSWASIKDQMLEYMADVSKLRMENLRCIAIRDRRTFFHTAYVNWRMLPENLAEYPADSLMPNAADVLEFSPVQNIINSDRKVELDMDLHVVPCLADSLPREIVNWRERVVRLLCIMLFDTRVWIDAKWEGYMRYHDRLALLEHAVVVFRCKKVHTTHYYWEEKRLRSDVVFPANAPNLEQLIRNSLQAGARAPVMWYPQFLHHQCASMTQWTYFERRAKANECLSMVKEYEVYRHAPWDSEALEFDERASRTTRNILDACGMDWRNTTTRELDERDPRLVCLKCSFGARCDGERNVRVWSWRDAVQHSMSAHFGDAQVLWECLSAEDTAEARLLDEAECKRRKFHAPSERRIWRCMKCRDTNKDWGRMSWASLTRHFTRLPMHGDANNMEDKEGTLYYRALDVCPREGPPIKMVPSKKAP